MKRTIAVLVAISIALFTAFAAVSESAVEELVSMEGMLIEITEDGSYLIESAEYGEVLVLTSEETFADVNRDIIPGDYLYIDYNGQMSRSIPPQITASVVRMHVLTGTVVEVITEENTVLLSTDTHGEVLVHMPEEWKDAVIDTEFLTVYFNGAMTMSLPAQIGAGFVSPGYTMQGVVTEISDGYLMLGEGMEAVQVNYAASLLPENVKTGDVIRVLYNGQMTRSIPAQINADEIIQISR